MEFHRDMVEVLRLRVQECEERYLSKRIEADQLAEKVMVSSVQGWSSSERVMTERNRAELAVSTYRELLLRAPGCMQIDRTLGDAICPPPRLRPQRALYLPSLCIEAKLAQARDVLATVRPKVTELTTKDASLEEVWRLAKRDYEGQRPEGVEES
eukprot:5651791-Pleurochrysis_carterae.AAC.1